MSRIPLWSFQFPEIRSPHVLGGMLSRKLQPVVHHLTMVALSGRGVRGMGGTCGDVPVVTTKTRLAASELPNTKIATSAQVVIITSE